AGLRSTSVARSDHFEHPHPVNYYCLRPYIPEEVFYRSDVCAYLKRSPTAVDQYAHKFGLGRRFGGKTAFSKVAVRMFAHGDIDALGLYLRGDRSDPRVTSYYQALGIDLPAAVGAGA
ncbi:hypothetical protein, partial [Heyndrickxia sporothermodurans]